jgi:hypothetical protein
LASLGLSLDHQSLKVTGSFADQGAAVVSLSFRSHNGASAWALRLSEN